MEIKSDGEIWEHASASSFLNSTPLPAFIEMESGCLEPNFSAPLGHATTLPAIVGTEEEYLANAGFTLRNLDRLMYLLQPCGWVSMYLLPFVFLLTYLGQNITGKSRSLK